MKALVKNYISGIPYTDSSLTGAATVPVTIDIMSWAGTLSILLRQD